MGLIAITSSYLLLIYALVLLAIVGPLVEQGKCQAVKGGLIIVLVCIVLSEVLQALGNGAGA